MDWSVAKRRPRNSAGLLWALRGGAGQGDDQLGYVGTVPAGRDCTQIATSKFGKVTVQERK
jgi:hypothetical protein